MKTVPALVVLVALIGCAAPVPDEDIEPGERPAVDTDEAGLWMVMDRAEAALRRSGRLEEDPVLAGYLDGLVCRLVPEHCGTIRVYIVRQPGFNASMAPNGFMQVWTGMLLRAENEDQVAFVLSHELAHYLERHTLERWRDARAKLDAAAFLGFATAVVGVPAGPYLVQAGAIGSILAFGRDQEREADSEGLMMLYDAGFAPMEAATVWANLLSEAEADDKDKMPVFLSTHPATSERLSNLKAAAARLESQEMRSPDTESYRIVSAPHRGDWLRDELRLRRFGVFEVLLDRLLAAGGQSGEIFYYKGELFRLRDEDGDEARALAAYKSALEHDGTPAQTYREIGLIEWSRGDRDAAASAFRKYLRLTPDADDRRIIEDHIAELEK